MNILITGGKGYIAQAIYNALKTEHNITLLTRNDFDLIDCKQKFEISGRVQALSEILLSFIN